MKKLSIAIALLATCSCSSESSKVSKSDSIHTAQQTSAPQYQQEQAPGPIPYHPDSCKLLAERMMMSTPVFKAMEAKKPRWLDPDIEGDTYMFRLYQDLGDHINTVAWILVDLKKGAVFEQDIANDILVPLDFDKSLIGEIGRCHTTIP